MKDKIKRNQKKKSKNKLSQVLYLGNIFKGLCTFLGNVGLYASFSFATILGKLQRVIMKIFHLSRNILKLTLGLAIRNIHIVKTIAEKTGF